MPKDFLLVVQIVQVMNNFKIDTPVTGTNFDTDTDDKETAKRRSKEIEKLKKKRVTSISHCTPITDSEVGKHRREEPLKKKPKSAGPPVLGSPAKRKTWHYLELVA